VQPGVASRQVLEMSNVSDRTLLIHAGVRLLQIVLLRCEGSAVYQGRFARQDNLYPAPRFCLANAERNTGLESAVEPITLLMNCPRRRREFVRPLGTLVAQRLPTAFGEAGPAAAGDECGQERELTDPGWRLRLFLKKSAAVPSATAANNHEAGAVSTNAAVAGRVAPKPK
jgi:hypothetical protein